MKRIQTRKERSAFFSILQTRASGMNRTIEEKVRTILDDVRRHGDKALYAYTEQFDSLKTNCLRLSSQEISHAAAKAEKNIVKALSLSARRIRVFHKQQREKSWSFSRNGIELGQIIRPIERAGIYVPGGKAAYPSTVLMNVIPAQVAGVGEIAVCVPAPKGKLNPAVMAVLQLLGIQEVYRIGGAQAIAAMAYGTKTVRKVDKITGPGNIYVATAKRMVYGEVDIDMIAGPSEVLIIADETANPAFIAADILSQAEHDEHASSVLVTPSGKLADSVRKEVQKQLITLRRRDIAQKSLESFGAIMLTRDMQDAAEIANRIAPEHLEIMTARPKDILPLIKHAGAIFLGEWTPEALGDYSAGPNHTLPTGGTARFSSPLGVYDFMKRSSLLCFTRQGFNKLAETVKTIADAEGLEAHGNSIRVRQK
ncbi:MAG: histidinol dehydrogenase [Thermodesulfovibrionales bacterium]|nr:histidinol dehydrogenase [Thermodesulfovibrionales bacterium]